MIQFERPLFWIYGFFAVWALFTILVHFIFNPAPWTLILTFFLVLFWPGFCLARIFKISFGNDSLGQIISWMTLGFLFSFLICFLAIIFGFTLPLLINLYFIVLGLLFFIAFFIDLKGFQLQKETFSFNLREIFRARNLIFLLLGAFIILILIAIDQAGANFKGDPRFHLAILRKVVENQPLTVEGLSYIKFFHRLPYVFPIWHVFLGMISKISGMNIFSLWSEIPLSLSVLVLAVWYWFFKKILPNREIAYLALFLFIIYFWLIIFAFDQYGYMFARLAVPDTLGQLFLLPLSIALSLRYIFDKQTNYKDLLVVSLLVIMMAVIHFTHYFYFLSVMGFFAVGFSILKFRDPEYKVFLRKILLTIFTNMIMVLPFLILLELKDKVLSKAIALYFNVQNIDFVVKFTRYDLYTKLSFIVLPFLLLFIKKYKKISFIFLLFLIIPIVYIQPIEIFLGKILSWVFIRRFYNNVAWPFLIWALILGFLLVLFDRLISKLSSFSKYIRYGVDSALGILAVILVWLEIHSRTLTKFYNKTVFSKNTISWLVENYVWLIASFTIIVIIILLLQKYSKQIGNFFVFTETQNKISNFLLLFMLIFFLVSPAFKGLKVNFKKEISEDHFFTKPRDPTLTWTQPKTIGGMETVDFIKENIPPKSIFDSNSGYFMLSMLVDQYMSDYNSGADKTYGKIYLENVGIEERLACLNKGKIDYILLVSPKTKTLALFDNYPQYFEKIYPVREYPLELSNGINQQKATIYKVQKKQISFAGESQATNCRSK